VIALVEYFPCFCLVVVPTAMFLLLLMMMFAACGRCCHHAVGRVAGASQSVESRVKYE
jgi:hypothetical protein